MSTEPAQIQAFPAPDEFLANQTFLRRLARELLGDAIQAEDVLQDTWLAWRERRPAALAEPRAWLTRVLQNRARNARREEQRRVAREQRAARPEADEGELARATLEVQAEVVALLQALEEPLQSALVLRYFHGLAPAEIAARTGAPLNTVKSRLTRALARLREELDRRHARDRREWSRCLLPLALEGGGAGLELGGGRLALPADPRATRWLALVGGGCALVVLSVFLFRAWSRRPAAPGPLGARAEAPELAALAPALAPAATPEPAAQRTAVQPARAASGRIEVEWPQFARTAAHDGFDPKLQDGIRNPAILWHVPDSFGQPTLSGGDLYSGGRGLFRIDAATGLVLARVLEPEKEEKEQQPEERPLTVSQAPALARGLVLARRERDGGVTAFDRELTRELWSWTPEVAGSGHFTGCLAGELFVVPVNDQVVALKLADGRPAWSVASGSGAVNMVPASADGRVYFGSEGGVFQCVRLADGVELWRTDTRGQLGWTSPVVVKDRLVLADRGSVEGETDGRRGELRCLATKDGKELWHTSFGATGFSTPGVGPGYVVGGFGRSVARFDLAKGGIDEGKRVATGQNAFGSPTVVGKSLVFGNLDGNLYVHELDTQKLRWRFHLAPGQQAHDFVHAGDRLFLATTDGLWCLGDDGSRRRPAPELVLESTSPVRVR